MIVERGKNEPPVFEGFALLLLLVMLFAFVALHAVR
jgi:hypothetical protein